MSSHLALALLPGTATWLVPRALHYRRGAWAVGGILVTLALLVVLGAGTQVERAMDARLFPLVGAPAWLFAALGLATCLVAYRDRRPATVAALLALVALGAAALGAGTWSWCAFGACVLGATLRAFIPPPPTTDDRAAIAARNRTRRSRSIFRKLVREGRYHWVPVCWLLRLSDLGREGIDRSGSYRFADHIYRMQPSGRWFVGRLIDRFLLKLPASRAFRLRYQHAQTVLRTALESFPSDGTPLQVLAIPCGLPRDLTELAATLRSEDPALLARIHYHGMDIDPELLGLAREFALGCGVGRMGFIAGNALVPADYPTGGLHAVVSTGLGEFLDETELVAFYRNVHGVLRPGGTFYTSVTRRDPRSDAMLRAFEMLAHYRTTDEVAGILGRLPWSRLTLTQDPTGLQTFVVAVK